MLSVRSGEEVRAYSFKEECHFYRTHSPCKLVVTIVSSVLGFAIIRTVIASTCDIRFRFQFRWIRSISRFQSEINTHEHLVPLHFGIVGGDDLRDLVPKGKSVSLCAGEG